MIEAKIAELAPGPVVIDGLDRESLPRHERIAR